MDNTQLNIKSHKVISMMCSANGEVEEENEKKRVLNKLQHQFLVIYSQLL